MYIASINAIINTIRIYILLLFRNLFKKFKLKLTQKTSKNNLIKKEQISGANSLGNRDINIKTETDDTITNPSTKRYTIPKPQRLVFASKTTSLEYISSYRQRYGFIQIRNSSKKKNEDSTTIEILFKYTRSNRKNKLITIRTGREAKRKMYIQKIGYSATITLSANDKDNLAGRQSLLLGIVTIHSYKSIKSTSLVYYRRQLRDTRSSGVLP